MIEPSKRKVFLNPGDFVFAESGTHLHTVLGTCVAITLWHPELQIGGMCHYLLPSNPETHALTNPHKSNIELNGRYADEAMQLFELSAQLHRTSIEEYQAKIFGGADTFTKKPPSESLIGAQNVAAAVEMLNDRNINVSVAHVGESGSRKIIFDVETGDVWVNHTNEQGQKLYSMSGRI